MEPPDEIWFVTFTSSLTFTDTKGRKHEAQVTKVHDFGPRDVLERRAKSDQHRKVSDIHWTKYKKVP